ncbi:MAG TPA: hypothetical protein VK469_18410 [Candidatus Kapabacteria bacterium]|nr:hypothetical protein [Candidatus Kapabacteria bacterium]
MSTASTRKIKKPGCSDFAGLECHQPQNYFIPDAREEKGAGEK